MKYASHFLSVLFLTIATNIFTASQETRTGMSFGDLIEATNACHDGFLDNYYRLQLTAKQQVITTLQKEIEQLNLQVQALEKIITTLKETNYSLRLLDRNRLNSPSDY